MRGGRRRVLATESIAGPTVEGACARTGPCVHGATREGTPRKDILARDRHQKRLENESSTGDTLDPPRHGVNATRTLTSRSVVP